MCRVLSVLYALSDLASPGDPCGIGSTVLGVPILWMKKKQKDLERLWKLPKTTPLLNGSTWI